MRTSRAAILAAAALVAAACGNDDDLDDATPPPDDLPAAEDDLDGADPDEDVTDDADDAIGEPSPIGEDGWTELASAPQELSEVGAAAFEGELWVAGGLAADPPSVTDAVQVYDPQADAWREGPDLPLPIHHAPLVATDAGLVLVGGYSSGGESITFDPIDDVYVLDQEAGSWVEGPSLPAARGAGAAAWDGERLVLGGGIGDDGLAADVWALEDLEGGEWTEVGELSVARDHLAATSDGEGNVWFLAGREDSLEANLATVDLLTADGVDAIGELPTPRGGVGAFFSRQHGACLAGGEEPQGTFAEVECITADGDTTALPQLSSARHGLGAATIDGIAYTVLGGTDPGLAVSGTIEALRVEP